MWFKHRAWIPVAWLLSVVNLVAVWFAAQPGEPLHASTHALFAVLFGLGAQRLMTRNGAGSAVMAAPTPQEFDARLASPNTHQLAESLDAIALEVERIGEGQRFMTKLMVNHERPVEEPAKSSPGDPDSSKARGTP